MARKAGTAPLGHAWDSKTELEGPHKHHDNHGMDASVPGKAPISQKHWEHHYSLCEPSRVMKTTEGSNFNAWPANKKPTTHLKVNKEDH